MPRIIDLALPPEVAFDETRFREHVLRTLHLTGTENVTVRPLRRSIDARGRQIKVNVSTAVYANETPDGPLSYRKEYPDVNRAPQAIVVGAGPAGMFAALRLIELGIKPVVLERGKDVRARRRDLAAITREHIVNPDSNYCFGEGGAGTYSDGKLYTRATKRGDVRRILEIFVAHGATAEILVDAHPHIGTNKLPNIVTAQRESILAAGGEFLFNKKVTGFLLENGEMAGVRTEDGHEYRGLGVILATGHSARDIFELMHQQGIAIEAKPFAMGVRIEHQQSLIDQIQYHCSDRGDYLPASSYSLAAQVRHNGEERGVFSFCMCPGGYIVPAATAPGEIVVNGMSPSRRDSKYANSGMVVAINEPDWQAYRQHGPLAALRMQQELEQRAFRMAGGTQVAPAQRMTDFVKGKVSSSLLSTSYQPGLVSMNMHEVLPAHISVRLREGFKVFGNKMRGYLTDGAQLIGIESRTSSPVRIPRDRETLEHTGTKRLFPCAEGAGYAGGIVSAAMDGERCAEQLAALYAGRKAVVARR
jgi:uncharacterized FAD-dependent dehydrogenase